jgi:hypothetical protein
MASVKMQEAYTKAKKDPMRVTLSVYTHGGPGPDSSWKKEEKKRRKAELERLDTEIKKFDRDRAADKVMSALMRAQERAKRDLEDFDGEFGGGVTL